MKKQIKHKFSRALLYRVLLINATLMVLSGCVALQSFPTTARSGDTITLAVGSADGMTTSNTTVDFFSDASPTVPISVPVRSIFNLTPDKTSTAWLNDSPVLARRSSHGAWQSVVVVDLPDLPEGSGFFRVSTDSVEVAFPNLATTPNSTDIAITILPGTGSPSTFGYSAIEGSSESGALSKLEPLPQVVVIPPVPAEGTADSVTYGAIEMDLTVPISDLLGGSVQDEGIAVILDDQPQNVFNQTQLIWKRTNDDYNIMLVSPKGMYSYEARVSIVPRLAVPYLYQFSGTPRINSVTYYDMNGEPTSGPVLDIYSR